MPLFLACDEAVQLAGAEHVPPCDGEELVGVVAVVKSLPSDVTLPFLSQWWPIDSERRAVECGDYAWVSDDPNDRVQAVSIADAYPLSMVGYVGRTEVTYNKGAEWEFTTPAIAPAWGPCQGQGCYCAGTPDQCEALPVGGPDGYYLTRLARLQAE